jgi:hypothetical protein
VDEGDLATEDAAPRLLVDELRAGRREAGEFGGDIGDLERDVMQPRTSLGEELADGRVGASRREQLDPTLAEEEKCDLGTLVVQGLPELDLSTEQPPVRLDRPIEVVDRDPDVVDAADRHPGDATGGRFPWA